MSHGYCDVSATVITDSVNRVHPGIWNGLSKFSRRADLVNSAEELIASRPSYSFSSYLN